jgi:hypothetical protein
MGSGSFPDKHLPDSEDTDAHTIRPGRGKYAPAIHRHCPVIILGKKPLEAV